MCIRDRMNDVCWTCRRTRAGMPRWWPIPLLPTLPASGSCSTTVTDMAARASALRDRLSDGDGPIQSAAHHREGVRLHSRSDRTGASGERRAVLAAAVSYTHLRAHETPEQLVCRLLLEKKK